MDRPSFRLFGSGTALLIGTVGLLLLSCSSERIRGSEAIAPVGPPSPWMLTFSNAARPLGSDKGFVFVTIEHRDKQMGKGVKRHVHYAGDRIGWWPERPEGEPVSRHPVVLPDGSTPEVDFNTGYTLMSVEPKTILMDITRCKLIFGPDGRQEGCEPIRERRAFSTHEVVLQGAAGEERVFVPDPARSPMAAGPSCPLHAPK